MRTIIAGIKAIATVVAAAFIVFLLAYSGYILTFVGVIITVGILSFLVFLRPAMTQRNEEDN